jgi:hypothetical protein
MHSKVWVGCWLLLCWPAICTVYTHTTIVVNSSQNLSISVQVENGITSLLASYIVTSWDTLVTWLPTDPRPLGRTCLGRTWWIFFLWWPSNRHQRVEDQEPVKSSLVSECWIWCMWPIISICCPWGTSSLCDGPPGRWGELHMHKSGFFGLFMLNMMYVANHFNPFPMVDLILVVETKLTKTK